MKPTLLAHLLVSLRRHWPHYLTEAAGIMLFLVMSTLATVVVQYPGSPLRWALAGHGQLRLAIIGAVVGLTIVVIVYSPWGKRSGAHVNPAVTLGFWTLGKIKTADAIWYVLAQAAGAVLAGQLLLLTLGPVFAHPTVDYVLTQPVPLPGGQLIAFAAEFLITFFMTAALLLCLHSKLFKKLAGWILGLLLAVYIVYETPYSGMSLNPARSLGSAVAAGHYAGLWVYLVAPPLAAWLAAVLFHIVFRNSPLSGSIIAGSDADSGNKTSTKTDEEPPQHPVE